MGFRAGAQKIFGGNFAPEAPSLGEVGNIGQLAANVQSQKASLAAKQQELQAENLKSAFSVMENLGKMPGKLNQTALSVLGKFLTNADVKFDPAVLKEVVSNGELMTQFGQLRSKLNNASTPEEQQAILGQMDNVFNNMATDNVFEMVGKDFHKTFETANADDVFKREGALRQEFFKVTDDIRKVGVPFAGLTNAYKEILKVGITPANMQTMVTLFNKLTDPGSVVRESEFNRFFDFASIRQRAANFLDAANKGTPIQPEQIDDLFDAARSLAEPIFGQFKKQREFFEQEAIRQGGSAKSVGGLSQLPIEALPASSLELRNQSRQQNTPQSNIPDTRLKRRGAAAPKAKTSQLYSSTELRGFAESEVSSGRFNVSDLEAMWSKLSKDKKPMPAGVKAKLKKLEQQAKERKLLQKGTRGE